MKTLSKAIFLAFISAHPILSHHEEAVTSSGSFPGWFRRRRDPECKSHDVNHNDALKTSTIHSFTGDLVDENKGIKPMKRQAKFKGVKETKVVKNVEDEDHKKMEGMFRLLKQNMRYTLNTIDLTMLSY